MKKSLYLFIAIIAAVSLYVAYEMVTFEQDPATPFVFSTPVLPEGITIGNGNENLTPEQRLAWEKTNDAIQVTVNTYSAARESIPQQAVETLDILTNQTVDGHVPPLFLTMVDPSTNRRTYETLKIDPTQSATITTEKKSIMCESQVPSSKVLIGNDEDNTLECSLQNEFAVADRMFLGGPGNDKITDIYGNRVVNGGTGNDTIALGKGRSIIILDAGWGNDQLTVDCDGATVAAAEVPPESGIPYPYSHANLIVLSPRIQTKDIKWDGNVLKSLNSADTLTVNEKCFSVVPAVEQLSQ